MIYHLRNLFEMCKTTHVLINGKWVPSRPIVAFGLLYRIKAAWLVLTKKADAVIWPEGQ
jgi:hypothetical protein